jgi:uncharacterized membrane protein
MADIGEVAVTQDERTMGTLAHVLQIVGWWIAPLAIFLLKRQSRFVSFHALQALLLQIVYMVFWALLMATWFVMMFGAIASQSAHPNSPPPTGMFILFPFIWLFGIAGWVLMLVVGIVYGIKAGRGEWAEYPVLGGLARRMLHF